MITITKPIKKPLANALRGCCKDIVTNIDGILEEAYMIFNKTELCSMCGSINNNIFIVVDDDQVIYGLEVFTNPS